MIHWKRIGLSSLAALALAFCLPATAEDIDLFGGVEQNSSSASNVLFVMDNGANWASNAPGMGCAINENGDVKTSGITAADGPTELNGTSAAIQQCALYAAINDIDVTKGQALRVGVMGFNGSGINSYHPATHTTSSTECTGGTGGCLLVPFTLLDATTKPRILNWIRLLRKSEGTGFNISTNNRNNGAAMQEAWAYYRGKTGVSGRAYTGGSLINTCGGNNYVIFIGNAYSQNSVPNDQTNEGNSPRLPLLGQSLTSNKNAEPAALDSEKAALTGSVVTSCPVGGTASQRTLNLGNLGEGNGVYAIHWAGYMLRQGIKSYAVGITGPDCRAAYPGHLKTLAEKGGGKYFESNNFADLKIAFSTILNEILAVNYVFASASLPISVNTQGTYLNQVFIGMFRPQTDPRWMGNLKQYKFKASQTGGDYELKLVDATDTLAINTNTGFITQCARSFWGPSTKPETDYWNYDGASVGTCTTLDALGKSDFPDGDVVEKGAASYRLRVAKIPANRNVLTCNASTCSALTNFSDDTDLGKWIRGMDVKTPREKLGNSATDMRPSVHGDVVHSRPVAVDYGGSTGVVVFYGANDGMLRAVNGNQTGTTAGDELWAFVAPEHSSRFARIYNNTTPIDFPSENNPLTQKPYFFDGPITAHQNGSNVWIFASQRRGGRMVYAFDVTTPSAPAIKWRAGCTDSTDTLCTSTTITGIGQTWSAPRVIRTQAVTASGASSPLLIFGGGYDTCDDTDNGTTNNNCTSSSTLKGKHVYVLNADTGEVVRTFDTLRSVVGDVTVLRNTDGLAEYAYAADTGGNVYRINLTGASTSGWTITRIAALGRDTVPASATDGASARKFMYGPAVVAVPSRGFNAVLLGSGDREHPLASHAATAAVQNYFYMLMDKPTVASWLTDEATACGGTGVLCHASLASILSTGTTPANLNGKKGWRMELLAKEQVVTSAIVMFGELTFSTHQPTIQNSNTCTNSLGTARVYNMSYLDAAPPPDKARGTIISGGGLPPSPVSGVVRLPCNGCDKPEITVPFIIGSDAASPLEVKLKEGHSSAGKNKERVYWYIKK